MFHMFQIVFYYILLQSEKNMQVPMGLFGLRVRGHLDSPRCRLQLLQDLHANTLLGWRTTHFAFAANLSPVPAEITKILAAGHRWLTSCNKHQVITSQIKCLWTTLNLFQPSIIQSPYNHLVKKKWPTRGQETYAGDGSCHQPKMHPTWLSFRHGPTSRKGAISSQINGFFIVCHGLSLITGAHVKNAGFVWFCVSTMSPVEFEALHLEAGESASLTKSF